MSTFSYSGITKTADRLLKQFGTSATLTRTTTGAYDPSTGTATTTTTVQDVTAAVFDYKRIYVDGTLIKQGDQRALVSAAGIDDPAQGDVLAWNGQNYSVIQVSPIAPAGNAVLWELQVRHG